MEKIKKRFEEQIRKKSDINEHIETLLRYSKECEYITEMGVRFVSSTWAFLYSNPKKLTSYDIKKHSNINEVIEMSREYNIEFEFREDDVLLTEILPTDLLFIDTLHTYNQLINELNIHSKNVSKYIIIHDTKTYGQEDEQVYEHASSVIKTQKKLKSGLVTAINDFLNGESGKEWVLFEFFENNNGLTILKRTNDFGKK